jgi:hypothetical protein
VLTASLAFISQVTAQSVRDYAVEISASVQTAPPQIQLFWLGDPNTISLDFYRRTPNTPDWGAPISLALNATNYVDTNVVVGSAWEYRVSKYTGSVVGEGYIYAGMELPLVESRGKVIVIVDQTHAVSLATELARLQQDLVGDGWTVLRHDVARMAVDPANTSSSVWTTRSNELANVKALIKADYNADPANVKSVFLFGHVPVPYSGNINPDGHPEHQGAWPADGFYGDMNGIWLDTSMDTTLNPTQPSDQRARNVPGDGKFDRGAWPLSGGVAEVELQVGRVDLANLPAFPQTEQELLRQYLNKDHAFRHRWFTMEGHGLIDDELGVFDGEAFAACGWRSFAPFFGSTVTVAADWLTTLLTQNYLWGYGCGSGTYTGASGVATTSQLVTSDPRVVFTMLFGSYFGDWDSQDNLLRASIATTNYTLTSVWAGRPKWVVHHMALGETIGFAAKVTQNNTAANYSVNGFDHQICIALMGDPTLRMHIVAPPSAFLVSSDGSGRVSLSWNASPDSVIGYHVYRAPTAAGPFTRLNSALLTGTNYTDPVITTNVYMVRAVKLEVSGSGSYYNASQGIFQSLDGAAGAPRIVLFQPTNNATFSVDPAIQISADTFDPANNITNVAFYANGVKIGETNAPPYNLIWSNVSGGSYALTVRAICSSGFSAESSTVNIRVDNGGVPHLVITALGGGSFSILGDDILGRTYQIQFVEDVRVTNWQTLGTATANPSGTFQFVDSIGSTQRFYRTLFP